MIDKLSRQVAILVVDDNPAFRQELIGIVADLEHVTKAQGTGAENADVIASVLVSAKDTILIADYDTLKRATNDSVETWIRATTARIDPAANVRIVVLAKSSDELLAVAVMKSGAADYLPKRLVSAQLLRKHLRQFIDNGARQPRARRAAVRRAQRPKPDRPEVRINGYKVGRKLYESRDTEIYLAYSEALKKSVVLKVISKRSAADVELARFIREYETYKRMRDSSVACVYDYGETDDFAYMTIERFKAGSLKDRLATPLSRRQALRYLREIARALRPVHALNVVHRDLKPSNVMLRDDDSVALIDFGIVKELGEGAGLTRQGELRGSPYYMSPEQASGHDIDCRSDIYSLGVVLYEMLTGQKPYVGKDLMDVLSQHIDAPPPRLPGVLGGYQPLIDYMMAKDPAERIATVEDLLNDPALTQLDNPQPYAQPQRA